MPFPTNDQRIYIEEAPPDAILIASPGSGKTTTAVERFISRCKLRQDHGIAYLSYTKVAVREARRQAMDCGAITLASYPNEILTIDSFFRTYVFDVFAYIIHPELPRQIVVLEDSSSPATPDMKAVGVWGVLQTKNGAVRPLPSWKIQPYVEGGELRFRYEKNEYTHEWQDLPKTLHKAVIMAKRSLLESGYSTHADLLLFSRLLLQRPILRVAGILAKRFREIIVDEAQDTSEIQQGMFEQFSGAGAQISYVGDPGQGIYQFNKANPRFLTDLIQRGRKEFRLDETFRSIKPIVDVLNARFSRGIKTNRPHENVTHGAFAFVGDSLTGVKRFKEQLAAAAIPLDQAAIIGRYWSHIEEFVNSDLHSDWSSIPRYSARAYQALRLGELGLALDDILRAVRAAVDQDAWRGVDEGTQRQLAWGFLRGPHFAKPADTESTVDWCGRLRKGLEQYLNLSGLQKSAGFGQNASTRKMDKNQTILDAISVQEIAVRTTVIHQVKGETIRGVLVLAPTTQHLTWLNDVKEGDEEFNVSYVAFSRAADLLMLQCPTVTIANEWGKHGFVTLAD